MGILQLTGRPVDAAAMHRSTIASCRADDNAENLSRAQLWLPGLQHHGATQASWWLYGTQYKQVEWETPAGELVRRLPPPTTKRERVGAGIRTLSIGKTGLSLAHPHTRIFSSGSGNMQQLYDVSTSGLGPSWEVAFSCGNAPVCQAAPKQHRTCCHPGGGV